jgi:hypothetical protein
MSAGPGAMPTAVPVESTRATLRLLEVNENTTLTGLLARSKA